MTQDCVWESFSICGVQPLGSEVLIFSVARDCYCTWAISVVSARIYDFKLHSQVENFAFVFMEAELHCHIIVLCMCESAVLTGQIFGLTN
jgi:hypothetical protein